VPNFHIFLTPAHRIQFLCNMYIFSFLCQLVCTLHCLCSDLTGQTSRCVQKTLFCSAKLFHSLHLSILIPEDLYMFCILFSSGKSAIMSGSPLTQFYGRRKKSRHDVDAGEGSSKIPQPGTSTKRIVHRDLCTSIQK
jgi:hypothetical protein